MQIDSVHEMQDVYRKLLHSMSRPGTISTLQTNGERPYQQIPCNEAIFLIALTLFDSEVTFHVLPEYRSDVINKISELTFARYAPIVEADYVIALNDAAEDEIVRGLQDCKIGHLADPQQSAIWFIENIQMEHGKEWIVTGPGIKHETRLAVNISDRVLRTRNARTKEYPLGIDIIFIDDQSQIVCIPRTTMIVRAQKGG